MSTNEYAGPVLAQVWGTSQTQRVGDFGGLHFIRPSGKSAGILHPLFNGVMFEEHLQTLIGEILSYFSRIMRGNVTYVSDTVLQGCVITRTQRVRPRARDHATLQNGIRDISYIA